MAACQYADVLSTFLLRCSRNISLCVSKDLDVLLENFDVYARALQAGREHVVRIAEGSVLMAHEDGIDQLELRWAPSFMDGGASFEWKQDDATGGGREYPERWDEDIEAILEGVGRARASIGEHKAPRVGLICILVRHAPLSCAEMLPAFCRRWREHLVGFDIASSETIVPLETWSGVVSRIHEIGLPLTVHVGEGLPADEIRRALDTYAPVARIGHATSLLDDDELVQRVIRDKVHVECNPTSNVMTSSVPSYAEHPVKRLLAAGVHCSVSTDDPTLFDITASEEWARCVERVGLSREDLLTLDRMAREASFIGRGAASADKAAPAEAQT